MSIAFGLESLAALELPAEIRRRHRRRADLTPSQWAERFRLVTEGPLVAQGQAVPWNNRLFPPAVSIMEAAGSGRWRRVVMLAGPQTSGKTALAINVLLWGLHWKQRDVMYVHANAAKAEAQYAKKIGPAIAGQPTLAQLIPPNRDDVGTKEARRFTNGTMFLVTGSESEADLSGPTVPVLFFDDVHAMPKTLGAHGHPVEFAEKRAAAFPVEERVCIVAGQASDTDNWLWSALLGSAFYVLYVPCPSCGRYQLLDWNRMQFDHSSPEAAAADCWLKCADPECDHHIRHEELPAMLERYAWVSTPVGLNPVLDPAERSGLADLAQERVFPNWARPTQDAGFWWNALYWPLVPWTKHAADWVSAQGQESAILTFRQQVQVIPFEPPKLDEDALELSDVYAHALKSHHWGTVPKEAGVQEQQGALIVTADVQAGYLWYLVCAWHRPTGTSWLVECGRFGKRLTPQEIANDRERHLAWRTGIGLALEKLWKKEAQGWPILKDDGELLGTAQAACCLIDCSFEREVVQRSCKQFNAGAWVGKWLPAEGSQALARSPVPVWPGLRRGTIERKTRRRYWEINTNRAKLYLREMLAIPPGSPGALNLPADMPDQPREWFAKHLCAEEWDDGRGRWVKVSGENHLLDCAAEQIAGAMAQEVAAPWLGQQAGQEQLQRPVAVVKDWFKRQKEAVTAKA